MSVNRTELIAAIAEKAGLTKTDADAFLGAFQDVLVENVAKGSRRTLLEKLIDIEDVDEEIKRLSEESDEYDHREYGIDLERLDANPQETE